MCVEAGEAREGVVFTGRRASRRRLGRRSTAQRRSLVVRANGPEGGRATSLRWWTGHREHKLKEQGLVHSSESIAGQARPKAATRAGPPRRTKQPLKPLAQLLKPPGRSSDWRVATRGPGRDTTGRRPEGLRAVSRGGQVTCMASREPSVIQAPGSNKGSRALSFLGFCMKVCSVAPCLCK